MRLVDADDLEKRLHEMALIEWNQRVATSWSDAFLECEDMVYDTQTVDAVEVVRCKDCVHYCRCYVLGDSIEDDDYYMVCGMGLGAIDDDWSVNDKVFPDDFCSRGEMRKDGKTY